MRLIDIIAILLSLSALFSWFRAYPVVANKTLWLGALLRMSPLWAVSFCANRIGTVGSTSVTCACRPPLR